jgi:hypothetical protein
MTGAPCHVIAGTGCGVRWYARCVGGRQDGG